MSGPRVPSKTGSRAQPWFVAGDVDGFFALVIDNLIQFLLILVLCGSVLGFETDLIVGSILPAAALSILVGNAFYFWQAQTLSARTGRRDVTALPYGINTVSLFAYVFLVMLPVKLSSEGQGLTPAEASRVAWQAGLAACFVSGVIETVGSVFAGWIRRHTPRAAMLSTLAGIAISFIAIDFAMQTFEFPIVAMLPLGVILTTFFSGVKLPFHLPGGVWAVALGSIAAWLLYAIGQPSPISALPSSLDLSIHVPIPVVQDLIAGFSHPEAMGRFVSVMIPMGLFNVLGSLQNLESAEASGDAYPTTPSLFVNGAGTIVASVFGSCFPTTIYIGHPGWKGLGARSGYSLLNGIFFVGIALLGLTTWVAALVPLQAGMAIVLWIGIVITGQAFQATPRAHAPAVAVGLFPAIAGWGLLVVAQTLGAAGISLEDRALADTVLGDKGAFLAAGLHLDGMIPLAQGFILSSMIWAAASVHLIERNFRVAAIWMGVGAVLAFFGFIHAGEFTSAGSVYDIGWGSGQRWAIGYVLCAGFFLLTDWWSGRD